MSQTICQFDRAHCQSAADVLAALSADEHGLSRQQARQRLLQCGANALPRPRPAAAWRLFLRQFLNPLVYILLFAAALSIILREWTDAGFIFAVLLINAVVGTVQEYQAERAAEALQRMVTETARVRREDAVETVPVESLVPGDVVLLESGVKVPADLRLLEQQALAVDESLLTGESLAVAKHADVLIAEDAPTADKRNMVFAGTLIMKGRATGVVSGTGMSTALGQIAEAVLYGSKARPPLMQRMERFTFWLAIVYVCIVAAMTLVSWWQGAPLLGVLLVAVALAVAAIPEGLPVALSVALAVGMSRMARRHVIVRRLVAAETLGSCTVIAADKTGTLTVNELTVRQVQLPGESRWPVTGEGMHPGGAVQIPVSAPAEAGAVMLRMARVVALCNEADLEVQANGDWRFQGDTVDAALLVFAEKAEVSREDIAARHPQIAVIPFEPERQYAATLNHFDHQALIAVKGAVERILPMCTRMATTRGDVALDAQLIEQQAIAMAREGYRVLAVAEGRCSPEVQTLDEGSLQELVFLGLTGMLDPPRPEAGAAVAACREAGVRVLMLTGDHPETALAIARQVGLAQDVQQVVTGRELRALKGNQDSLDERVAAATVFARIEPEGKLEIVHSLMRTGQLVAVTGDGANDAPALRAAHVGVAMGKKGSDVARESADLVITDDNFASLVEGIKEGRIAYANVRKVVFLLISTGAAEVLFFIISMAAGLPLPLTAVQLLWVNVVTEGIQHVGLAFEPEEGDEMRRSPRPPGQAIFDRLMIERCLVSAVTLAVIAYGLFSLLLQTGVSIEAARNETLLLMVLFENVQVFNARSEYRSALLHNPLRNRLLLFGTLGAQLVHIAAMYTPGLSGILEVSPVTLEQWLRNLGLVLVIMVFMELYKIFRRRYPL